VDVEIVHDQVRRAVSADADDHADQPAEVRQVEPGGDHDDRDPRKHHGEQVVSLEAANSGRMMAAMPGHGEAVHHETVGQIGEGLHRHERDHDDHPRVR